MIEHLVPLLASLISPDFMELAVYPIFCLYFIGAVPGIFRTLVSWR